jgi:N-ethylmaleimide reductase
MYDAIDSVSEHTDLFEQARLGPYQLENRIVMAPMTRSRARPDGAPGEFVAEYYAQRASVGLIISEATEISPQAKGYLHTPGIYTDTHVREWRRVVDAVHMHRCRFFMQLWHVGRISHPSNRPDGSLPVAPSAIKADGKVLTTQGFVPFVTPRALETDEIAGVVEQYRSAAQRAYDAGFDGVEIHAANGYLIDQFLRDQSNRRTDAYGGTIPNRARILLEIAEAVAGVWGAERVGIRLSPVSPLHDMADSDPYALFSYVIEQMDRLGLAYIHLVEGVTGGPREVAGGFDPQLLRRLFKGVYIANNGYDMALAREARRQGHADLVAFGRAFIANPDLVQRLRIGAALNEVDLATLYTGGSKGYIDYPFRP